MLFSRNSGGVRWLVVCLGNPGRQYENTRHNAGFLAADALEKALNLRADRLRFRALTGVGSVAGESVMVMKPQTYMNLSGESAGAAASFYKIPPERVIVISDEMSLAAGRLRIREKGSAGGHNGLKNIIEHLGSDAFPRIRIGVGEPPHSDYDRKDWALSRLSGKDLEAVQDAAQRAAQAVLVYIEKGPGPAMNQFNQK